MKTAEPRKRDHADDEFVIEQLSLRLDLEELAPAVSFD
jgi:hypothetical protein